MDWFVPAGGELPPHHPEAPNVAPILLEFLPRDQLTALYDNAARPADRSAVPIEVHALILDGLETLTSGRR